MQTTIQAEEPLSQEFKKACKSKDLSFVGFNYENGKAQMILTLSPNVHGQKVEVRLSGDIKLRITNYSSSLSESHNDKVVDNKDITRIFFGDTIWGDCNHLKTFAQKVGNIKLQELWFEAVIFNNNENYYGANFVAHQLYGCIDNDRYLLESYVGPDNFVSPVKHK